MRRTTGQWMMLVVAVVGLVLVSAPAATGQEPTSTTSGTGTGVSASAVATAIAADGWYADEAAGIDRSELVVLANRLGAEDEPIGVAVLAAEPSGSSTMFAELVLDALPAGESSIETVAVLSPEDVGVVSDAWDDSAIDAALDESIDALRSDQLTGLSRLARALAEQENSDEQGTDEGSFPVALVAIAGVGIVGLVALGRRMSSGGLGSGSGYDYDSDSGWDSSYSRRRRWGSAGRSSSFRRSRGGGSGGSRRSSRRSSRGRGGRRL